MMRHIRERHNYLNELGVERGNMRKNIIHKLKKGVLVAAFCMVLSISMLCFADEQGVVLGDSCNIRATTDANGTVIGNAKKNQTISIISEVTGNDGNTWYQVWVDASTKGYIRADLVQKSSSSSATTTSTTTDLPETSVTAVAEQTATVTTNNVNIRKGAGTAYGAVATANKGMTLTVTGEASASNGQKWYQVKFTYNSKEVTGFIRSDLVSFGAVDTTEVSEITGSEVAEQPETETVTETENNETVVTEAQTQEDTTTSENTTSSSDMILMNVTDEPYIMPGFEQIILKWQDQDINAYKNGDFYIFYAQKQSGEEGWYVFDSTNGTYQRYAYAVDGVTTGSDNSLTTGLVPIIILVVIIVILLAVVGLLFIRLREYTSEEYDEEDEDEDEEENGEEVIEEEEPVRQRTRNPRKTQNAPVYEEHVQRREPVEEHRVEPERPVRRPVAEGQRPVRRSAANGQRPEETMARPEGQRPVRRPAVNGQRSEGMASARRESDRPVRPQNGEVNRRRPSGEPVHNRPAKQPQQQGYRAQNFLEKDDQDDIEFIDL